MPTPAPAGAPTSSPSPSPSSCCTTPSSSTTTSPTAASSGAVARPCRAEYGPAIALNAGDALAVLANQVLRRHTAPPRRSARPIGCSTSSTRWPCAPLEGQATELGWRRDNVTDLTPEDYLDLIMHKTCWYTTIHPLRVGALIGSAGSADLDRIVRFGFYLGAAFQIQDDLLNLVGDESAYGKEIDGDLYEGKRTLVLIHLVQHAEGADRDHGRPLPRASSATHGRPSWWRRSARLMDAYGSIEFTQAYAAGHRRRRPRCLRRGLRRRRGRARPRCCCGRSSRSCSIAAPDHAGYDAGR